MIVFIENRRSLFFFFLRENEIIGSFMVDSGWRLEEIGRGQFFNLFSTFEGRLRVNGWGSEVL